ncbi:MAG: hypothetical protein ACK4ZU_08190 [Allorhizobium sp.]|jgi:hypothetical protein
MQGTPPLISIGRRFGKCYLENMEKKMAISAIQRMVVLQDRKRLPARFHPLSSGTIRKRQA